MREPICSQVQLSTWRKSWADIPATGDTRYWPPSAWMCGIYGPKLEQPWEQQYVEQLDVFALAKLALEVYFGLASSDHTAWAAWNEVAEFATEAWTLQQTCSLKYVHGSHAAGNPEETAEELYEQLIKSDMPFGLNQRLQRFSEVSPSTTII